MNNSEQESQEEFIETMLRLELIWKKNGRNICSLLNKRRGYRAKLCTLLKYNIIYDDSVGKWVILDD